MKLRPYQARCVAEALAALQAGKRTLVTLPTGGGKSFIGQTIGQNYCNPLWAVPSVVLRKQAPGRAVTVQSLLGGHRPETDLLIVDEAHRAGSGAPEWFKVIQDYKSVLGLTATPCRHTGEPMGDQFDALIVGANYSELIRDGYLTPCRVVRPVDAPEEESGLAMQPVAAWKKYADGRQTAAFFSRVELAHRFADALPSAAVVWGEQDPDERAETMARFEAGKINVLASVSVITEGWDCPSAAVCLLAVMPAHEGSFLQRVGRVLRPAPGKTSALLIDLPGASFIHGFPTDDRIYSLDGTAIRRAESAPALSQCLQCGAVYPAAPVCPECGWIRPPKVRPPRIWGVPLELLDPAKLTPEQRGKLGWKEKMLADDAKRLEYLQKKAKSPKHACALHLRIFGKKMPSTWFRLIK
ncbi:MAG: DEAD/DEAH box helicase family protein [Chloroflexota bacterium]